MNPLRRYPLLSRLLVLVLLPVAVVMVLMLTYLQDSVPADQVDLAASDPSVPATIHRDAHGVAHIRAASDQAAFFALGYAHAQDRLWQLELQRRMARGQLSEVFGRRTVSQDAWSRALGIVPAAASAWHGLSDEAQASLNAYTDGINAWMDTVTSLPPEFRLLGIRPTPWEPLDCLAWMKIFALNLSGNMWKEISHYFAAQTLPPQWFTDLLFEYPADAPVVVSGDEPVPPALGWSPPALDETLAALLPVGHRLQQDFHIGGEFVGSNAWVVSGEFTEGGGALLANDPHLGLQMPSLWYVASIRGERLAASGMTLVGIPLVVFGRNEYIAWGGTSMMADVQDLYVEQINPEDPGQYLDDGEWRDFSVRSETIQVKADFPAALRPDLSPVSIEVRSSNRGPVISDFRTAIEQPVSLRWTALDPGDTSYEAFYRLNHARDWQEFQSSLGLHVAPAMNMLYGDRDGNIGYLAAGRIPIRSRGEGRLPVPAWTGEYRWTGFIPFEAQPRLYNPATGYIVSANHRVTDTGYPYFISSDWAPPARAERISVLLQQAVAANGALGVADMQRIQADTLDLSVAPLLPLLRALQATTDGQARALAALADWQGDMAADSPAASLFHVWMRHLRQQLFADELSGAWNRPDQIQRLNAMVTATDPAQIHAALTTTNHAWCDRTTTAPTETCDEILLSALDAAIAELSKLRGPGTDDWAWGDLQSTVYRHMPFSDVSFIDRFFERRVPNGGSANAVNVAASIYEEGRGYRQNFGPGFRQIIRMAPDHTEHLYMNSTGQSGNPASDHFDDMVVPFQAVEYHTLGHPGAGQN